MGQTFLSVRLLKTLDFRRTPDRVGRFPDGKVFFKRLLRVRLSLGCQMASETPFQRLPQIFQQVEVVRATPPPGERLSQQQKHSLLHDPD